MTEYPKSIVQMDTGICFRCGSQRGTEIHHLMNGADRKLSTKYGLVIGLCPKCHRDVHSSGELMKAYKRTAQIAFEKEHSHEEWMSLFMKNYK